jgi:signal transduction histidine kinase/DNA-binding response OmpR family regulator/streptogramin lyase
MEPANRSNPFFWPWIQISPHNSSISGLLAHPNGLIYLSSFQGSFIFNPEAQTFSKIKVDSFLPPSNTPWNSSEIVKINDSIISITYPVGGLALLNTRTNKIVEFYKNQTVGDYFIDYKDPEDRLWSLSNGYRYFSPVRQQFKRIDFVNSKEATTHYDICRMVPDTSGRYIFCAVWLGDGIHYFDTKTDRWELIQLPESMLDERYQKYTMRDIVWSEKWGWVIIGEENIYQLKNRESKVQPFPSLLPENNGYFATAIQDNDGNIWIGTYKGELLVIEKNGKIENFTKQLIKDSYVNPGWIFRLHKDSRGRIWVRLTEKNFAVISPNNKKVEHHELEIPGKDAFSIVGFQDDLEGNTWISLEYSGLALYDPETPKKGIIKHVKNKEKNFYQGFCDENGFFWFSDEKGLFRFSPKDSSFLIVDYAYGAGTLSTFCQAADGQMYMGFRMGVVRFQPQSLRLSEDLPQPYLLSSKVLGKPWPTRLPLDLPYNQNDLAFEFSCISYDFPQHLQFSYRLKGLEEKWSQPSQENSVAYPRLSPGHYSFELKAINIDGKSQPPLSIDIKISPPWWRTLWFYLLSGSLSLLLLYFLYRFQLNRRLSKEETKRIKEMDHFRTRMLGNVTHEFRTPLTVIDGIAEEGQKSWSISPEARGQLETIRRQNKKVLQLVDQLMQLSSMDRQELKAEFREVEINPLLRSSIDSFQQHLNQKELLLETFLPETRITLNTDPEKLQQIIDNLLSNAVKFTPEGGRVKVEAGPKENKLLISVSDSGIGIPEEDLPHIFERFYQSKAPGRSDYEGTGIGLSIVREYTELLEGKIELKSREGEGARFDLWLPGPVVSGTESINHQTIDKENPVLKAPILEAEDESRPGILIVEDNLALRELLQIQLQHKYRLSFAGDGQRGLEKAQTEMPDLILVDWMMPEMNGLELCRQLKSELLTCHIPVIMLTAKVQQEDKLSGIQQGADAYITKPHDKKELQVRIRSLLENRRRLQKKYAGLAILPDQPTHNRDEELLQELARLVLENMGKEQFSIDWLASQLHLSRSAFDRKIKALTQRTAAIYIRSIRLKKAHHLIRETKEAISSIAYQCGYKNAGHFSQDFREEFGKSPSEHRAGGKV